MARTVRAKPGRLTLDWSTDGRDDCLVIRGWDDDQLARFRAAPASALGRLVPVYPTEVVESARASAALQPVAGRYAVGHDGIRFVPRFPFVAGTSYSVVLGAIETDQDATDGRVLSVERPMPVADPSTAVIGMFPTARSIPRNQLRLYVHFSAPMAEGESRRCISVVRADTGEPIGDPFTPTDPELWDPTRRRLTVLFDPARIKRGLRAQREVGYPLHEGMPIRVVVDEAFRDAAGKPLVQRFERSYEVGPDERRRVDPSAWVVDAPTAGTHDALVVVFDRSLDHALLQHCIVVVTGDGRRLDGVIGVERGESVWSFRPESPWAAAPHRIWVDQILEDGAGNSVWRVFDRDVDSEPSSTEGPAHVDFTPAS
jgi:hypothetical protein